MSAPATKCSGGFGGDAIPMTVFVHRAGVTFGAKQMLPMSEKLQAAGSGKRAFDGETTSRIAQMARLKKPI